MQSVHHDLPQLQKLLQKLQFWSCHPDTNELSVGAQWSTLHYRNGGPSVLVIVHLDVYEFLSGSVCIPDQPNSGHCPLNYLLQIWSWIDTYKMN